jgi:hypothetical protein
MNDTQLETLDQIRQFLEGTEAISFQIESKDARYRWIQNLRKHSNQVELDQFFKAISGIPYFCESSFWASKPKFAAKA